MKRMTHLSKSRIKTEKKLGEYRVIMQAFYVLGLNRIREKIYRHADRAQTIIGRRFALERGIVSRR